MNKKKCHLFRLNRIVQVISGVSLVSMMVMSAHAENLAYPSQNQNNIHQSTKNPNIIMIVLDDTGFADLGAFGSEIKTPNIDNLAYSGLRYNHFDSAAISAPTRAGLITGRNPQTVHIEELPPIGTHAPAASVPMGTGPATSGEIPTNAQNVAQALQSAGYHTVALGKWHLAPEYKDNDARNKSFWPRQRGFDYYYGFISGHTDQYHPALIENNKVLPVPQNSDYHLSVDLINHSIDVMNEKSDKPKFLYLALGAAHAPLQVPKSYIDAYHGKYDEGWDKLRVQRFAQQKRLGIIPADTVLPSREKGDAAWNSLDSQHKRVFSRFMETYAGFLTQTDEQIGRLINSLKKSGQYNNTLIMLITDNGAAPEGGANGGFRQAYMDKTSVEEMDKHLDEAGGPKTYMLYQRPWAYAGDTPFRRYKLWPYLGGVRTPLIVSWPNVIKDTGDVRHQYINVVDLAPTMLAAAHTEFAKNIDGIDQIPVAGQSFLETLTDTKAKTRDIQYFELRGNRAITYGKWRAVAMHRLGTDFSQDQWQLFNTETDFSESKDLSKKYPNKLKHMQNLWWEQARMHSDPPIIKPVEFLYKFNHIDDAFTD